MKKQRLCIALLAAIFVLGFVSCGGGAGNNTGGEIKDPNTDATLISVKFGNDDATLGKPAGTYAGIEAGSIVLLNAEASVKATPANDKATVKYAQVIEGATFDADALWVDTDFTFATGDALVIEVTAEDGKAKLYYKIGVALGNVALEDTLTVGGLAVTLPNPATTWQGAEAGSVLFQTSVLEQPAGGTVIGAETTDASSSIKYGKAAGDAEPAFSSTAAITFFDGDYLYIEVSSEDGTKAYYKLQINFKQVAAIKYGSPVIKGNDDKYIDPLWDDPTLATYIINKKVMTDTWRPPNGVMTTSGVGKALWDENGLYIYVEVTDDDVSTVPKAGSEAHETDSVELFVNEGLPGKSYSNGGSQYRVGANGERSGEGDSPAALEKLNKTSAWKTDTGYITIFQAPWRLRSKFFGDDTYKNGWKIGFELQVNAAPEIGQRYGTLVWNNTAHTNYQNANDYGEAELVGAPASLTFPPVEPRITKNPQSRQYTAGETVNLAVEAAKPDRDAGTLGYQWYKADSNAAADTGAPIAGETSAAYSFTTVAGDEIFYYAVVTNTIGAVSEKATSTRARIRVGDEADLYMPFDPVLRNTTPIPSANQPVHTIDLPADFDGSQYDRLSVDIHFYDSALAEVMPPKWSLATLQFQDADGALLAEQTNYGQQMTITEGNIPTAAQKNTLKKLFFRSADASAAPPGGSNYYDVRFIEIRSITFHVIVKKVVKETFTLDLTDRAAAETINNNPVAVGAVDALGVLTLTYDGTNNQLAAIKLTADQVSKVMASGIDSIRVTIDGSVTVDASFRYCLGTTGGNDWNGTALPAGNISTLLGAANTKDVSFSANKSAVKVGYFILQIRAATATEITINSITISTLK